MPLKQGAADDETIYVEIAIKTLAGFDSCSVIPVLPHRQYGVGYIESQGHKRYLDIFPIHLWSEYSQLFIFTASIVLDWSCGETDVSTMTSASYISEIGLRLERKVNVPVRVPFMKFQSLAVSIELYGEFMSPIPRANHDWYVTDNVPVEHSQKCSRLNCRFWRAAKMSWNSCIKAIAKVQTNPLNLIFY